MLPTIINLQALDRHGMLLRDKTIVHNCLRSSSLACPQTLGKLTHSIHMLHPSPMEKVKKPLTISVHPWMISMHTYPLLTTHMSIKICHHHNPITLGP